MMPIGVAKFSKLVRNNISGHRVLPSMHGIRQEILPGLTSLSMSPCCSKTMYVFKGFSAN